MPHHTGAPSGSPVFRIAADGELRTSRGSALSVLWVQERRGTVGFGAGGGRADDFVFIKGGLFDCILLFWLSFFRLLFIW